MTYAILAVIGILAGLMQGLFSGGGLVTVPALVYLQHYLKIPPDLIAHISIGTSLACITISGTAIALFNHQKNAIRWDHFKKLAPGVCVGAATGALFASSIRGDVLLYIIAANAAAGGIYILTAKQKIEDDIHNPLLTHVIALTAGIISALTGIAGATVLVPYLFHKGVDVLHSLATSIALGVIITAIAAINYGVLGAMSRTLSSEFMGYIWLPAVGVISVVSIISGYIGTHFIHGAAKVYMRRAFGVFSILVSMAMCLKITEIL